VVEGELVHLSGVTTVTAAASVSIDNRLSIQTDRGGVLKVVHDVKSVSEGAGSSLSPA